MRAAPERKFADALASVDGDGRLRFVMPTAIGSVEICNDISRGEILDCLNRLVR